MPSELKNTFKDFFNGFDLFAAQASLRYQGSPSYYTTCGATFSIILFLTFIVVFSGNFLQILNKQDVDAKVETEILQESRPINGLNFAIEFYGIDPNKFFYVTAQITIDLEQWYYVEFQLGPCLQEEWEGYPNFQKIKNSSLCPTEKFDLPEDSYIQIMIYNCHTGSSADCQSQQYIDLLLRYLRVTPLVLHTIDTVLSPTSENYQKNRMSSYQLIFSSQTMVFGTLYMGEYNITTDESILPWESNLEEHGYYVQKFDTAYSKVDQNVKMYVWVRIKKGQKLQLITRQFGKLDDMLSYVGGLFAIMFSFLAFFIGSYAEYKYALGVARTSFCLDELGTKYRPKDFHFLKYLKYTLYNWLKVFGYKGKWEEMQLVNEITTQATQQIDIRLVMKKLERLQNINQLLLKQRNLICAQLTEPQTLKKVRKLRKVTQYCDKILKHERRYTNNKQDNKDNRPQHLATQQRFTFEMEIKQSKDSEEKEVQIPPDFDDEDIEIERLIIKSYLELMNDDDIDPIEDEVMKKIPQMMKKRLDRLSNQQYYQMALSNGPKRESQSFLKRAISLKDSKKKMKESKSKKKEDR